MTTTRRLKELIFALMQGAIALLIAASVAMAAEPALSTSQPSPLDVGASSPAPTAGQGRSAEFSIKALIDKLKLTDAQAGQLRMLADDYKAKVERLKDTRMLPLRKAKEAEQLKNSFAASFRSILTAEQRTEFDRLRAREGQAGAQP